MDARREGNVLSPILLARDKKRKEGGRRAGVLAIFEASRAGLLLVNRKRRRKKRKDKKGDGASLLLLEKFKNLSREDVSSLRVFVALYIFHLFPFPC